MYTYNNNSALNSARVGLPLQHLLGRHAHQRCQKKNSKATTHTLSPSDKHIFSHASFPHPTWPKVEPSTTNTSRSGSSPAQVSARAPPLSMQVQRKRSGSVGTTTARGSQTQSKNPLQRGLTRERTRRRPRPRPTLRLDLGEGRRCRSEAKR